MFRKRLLPLVMLGLVVFAGCPQGDGNPQESINTGAVAGPTPAEELKGQLESLAELGEMMPGMESIEDNIAAVKAEDAEKGAALEKAFGELNAAMGNADAVKAKAKEMLEKL